MDKKTLLMTLTAAVVVTAIGVTMNQAKRGSVDLDDPLFFPGLAEDALNLNQITIKSAGDQLVVDAVKQEGKWVLANLGHYDADMTKLSNFLNAIKDAHKVEAKTSQPALFHHLGLRDLTEKDSKAALVSLTGAEKSYQVLLGTAAKNGTGHYVRLVSDNQTWLIDKFIDRPATVQDWVNRTLFTIKYEDIQSLAFSGTYNYVLSRPDKEAKDFIVEDIPDTQALKYNAVANTTPRIMTNMTFDHVAPISEWQERVTEINEKLVINQFDQPPITLEIAKVEDDHYLHIIGDNPLWQKWVYKISVHSYAQLVKDKAEYLQDKQPPQAEAAEGNEPAAELTP